MAVNVAIPFGDTVVLFAVSFTARFGVLFSTFIMTLDDAVAPVASVTVTVSVFAPVAIPATQSYLFGTISFAITTVFPFAVILYVYLYFSVPPDAVAVNVAIPFGDTVFLFAVSFTARFGVLFSTFITTLDDAVAPAASVTVTVSVFVPATFPAVHLYDEDVLSDANTAVFPSAEILYVYL